jgi:hypothetical protein
MYAKERLKAEIDKDIIAKSEMFIFINLLQIYAHYVLSRVQY